MTSSVDFSTPKSRHVDYFPFWVHWRSILQNYGRKGKGKTSRKTGVFQNLVLHCFFLQNLVTTFIAGIAQKRPFREMLRRPSVIKARAERAVKLCDMLLEGRDFFIRFSKRLWLLPLVKKIICSIPQGFVF